METLNTLKKKIMDKKLVINEMVLKNEKISAPELVKLSVELDTLLNKFLELKKSAV